MNTARREEILHLYPKIIENIAAGIFLIRTKDSVIVYANPAIEKIFGYDSGEMVGMHISAVNAPTEESPEKTAREISQRLQIKGTWRGEIKNIKKDGSVFWSRAEVSTFEHPEHGEVWIATHHDITEHKRIEDELRESERKYRSIAANIPGLVFQFRVRSDGSTYFSYLSPRADETGGVKLDSPDWALGKNAHPDDRERLLASVARSIENQTDLLYEGRSLSLSGDYRWHQNIASITQIGDEIVFDGIMLDIDARKRAEEALQESEQRYRRLFKNHHAMMLLIHPDTGQIVDANPAACTFYGYNLEEITSHNISDINTLSREQVAQELQKAKAEERSHFFFKHRLKSGEIRNVEVFSGPIEISGQKLLYSIIHDITARKQAEDALKKEEAFRSSVIQRAAEGICVCHAIPEFPFVEFTIWNEQMTQITGYNMEEINKYGWYQSMYPDPEHQEKAIARMDEMRNGENLVAEEWVITRADSKKRTITISSSVIQGNEDTVHVLAVMSDVTERKEMEEALRVSEEKYRLLFDNAGDAIFIHDDSLNILAVNSFGIRQYGYTREELMSMNFDQVDSLEESRHVSERLKKFMDQGHLSFETMHRRKDGSLLSVDVSAQRITWDGMPAVMSICRDITERKRAEESLKEANKVLQDQLNQINTLHETLREQAIRDSLTNVYNRRYLNETIERELARAKRENHPVSFMIIDIDHFKEFNDSYGHDFGDEVLIALSAHLNRNVRKGDIICRYGGDEFVVLMPDANAKDAENRAEKLRQEFNAMEFDQGSNKISATISIGISIYPQHGTTSDAIFRYADAALYQVKEMGRNRVQVWHGR